MDAWNGFKGEKWRDSIDVRDFIQSNYTPYTGDEAFLSGPTERTEKLLKEMCAALNEKQRSQLMELVWSIEELYDYIGFRGQAYAFSFGLSIGMETSELLEEDFCWE